MQASACAPAAGPHREDAQGAATAAGSTAGWTQQARARARGGAGYCSVLKSKPAVYFSRECKLSKAIGLDASVTVGGASLPLGDIASSAAAAASPAAAAIAGLLAVPSSVATALSALPADLGAAASALAAAFPAANC